MATLVIAMAFGGACAILLVALASAVVNDFRD